MSPHTDDVGEKETFLPHGQGEAWFAGFRTKGKHELLINMLEDSSAHAVKRLVQHAKLIRRAIWGLLFFAGLGAFFWSTVTLFQTYYDYETSTQVTIISSTTQSFPDVTICNLNPYKKQAVINSRFGTPELQALSAANNLSAATAAMWTDVIDDLYSRPPSMAEAKDLCFSKDDMIGMCTALGKDCSADDFVTIPSKAYCHCFRYAPKGTVVRTGASRLSDMITIQVDVNQDDYIPTMQSASGAVVIMQDKGTYVPAEEQGSLVSPGTESWFALRKQVVVRLPAPYGSCQENALTQVECKVKLLQTYIIGACGCKDPYYMTTIEYYDPLTWDASKTPHCYTQAQWDCANTATDNFLRNTSTVESCRDKCTDTTYLLDSSFATYPPPSSADIYRKELISFLMGLENKSASAYNFIDNTFFSRNYLQINVFFQQLNYEEYRQQPAMSAVGLLSSLGGNAGLFLGFSLLTFLEFVEYLTVMCMWWYHRRHAVHPSPGSSPSVARITPAEYPGDSKHSLFKMAELPGADLEKGLGADAGEGAEAGHRKDERQLKSARGSQGGGNSAGGGSGSKTNGSGSSKSVGGFILDLSAESNGGNAPSTNTATAQSNSSNSNSNNKSSGAASSPSLRPPPGHAAVRIPLPGEGGAGHVSSGGDSMV